jgi:hypothetical protein
MWRSEHGLALTLGLPRAKDGKPRGDAALDKPPLLGVLISVSGMP